MVTKPMQNPKFTMRMLRATAVGADAALFAFRISNFESAA
jgi:hypothetical protein